MGYAVNFNTKKMQTSAYSVNKNQQSATAQSAGKKLKSGAVKHTFSLNTNTGRVAAKKTGRTSRAFGDRNLTQLRERYNKGTDRPSVFNNDQYVQYAQPQSNINSSALLWAEGLNAIADIAKTVLPAILTKSKSEALDQAMSTLGTSGSSSISGNNSQEISTSLSSAKTKLESKKDEIKGKDKSELQSAVKDKRDNLNTKKSEKTKVKDGISQQQQTIDSLTPKINALTQEIGQLRAMLSSAHDEASKTNIQNQINAKEAEKSKLEKQKEQAETKKEELETKLKGIEEDITNLESEVKAAETELNDFIKAFEEVQTLERDIKQGETKLQKQRQTEQRQVDRLNQ